MVVLGPAIGEGLVSMRRAATLLELGVDDLSRSAVDEGCECGE